MPQNKAPRITRKCFCGEVFSARESLNRKFCSQECGWVGRNRFVDDPPTKEYQKLGTKPRCNNLELCVRGGTWEQKMPKSVLNWENIKRFDRMRELCQV